MLLILMMKMNRHKVIIHNPKGFSFSKDMMKKQKNGMN